MTATDQVARYVQGDGDRLRRRALISAIYSGGAQGATMAISMASMIILARLLTPADFGLFAICNLYVAFLGVIADGGLPLATVQAQILKSTDVNPIYWLGVGLGLVATLLAAAAGPAIAHFHDMPELALAMGVSGIAILIASLTAQQTALMRRNLEFGKIAIANVLGLVAGALVGVAAAWQGAGYWSLVMQAIANAFVRTAATWRLCRWRPSRLSVSGLNRGMLRFGTLATANEAIGYAERNLDQYALAVFSQPSQLGLYTRASTLLSLPTTQTAGIISGVVAPALCRVYGEPERYRRAFLDSVTIIATLALPACALMGLCAQPIVAIVLGEQWRESAEVIRALGIGISVRAIVGNPIGWSQVASGRIDRMAKWTLLVTPITALVLSMAGTGGATSVAWGLTLVTICLAPAGLWYSLRGTPVSMFHFGAAIGTPLVITAASLGVGIASQRLLGSNTDSPGADLLLPGSGFALTFALLTMLTRSGRKVVRELFRLVSK